MTRSRIFLNRKEPKSGIATRRSISILVGLRLLRVLQRYRAVPSGGNRFDLQRKAPEITPACWIRRPPAGRTFSVRLWWDRPSVTIRTEFFKPEKGRSLHPEQHRPITHREAAPFNGFS